MSVVLLIPKRPLSKLVLRNIFIDIIYQHDFYINYLLPNAEKIGVADIVIFARA